MVVSKPDVTLTHLCHAPGLTWDSMKAFACVWCMDNARSQEQRKGTGEQVSECMSMGPLCSLKQGIVLMYIQTLLSLDSSGFSPYLSHLSNITSQESLVLCLKSQWMWCCWSGSHLLSCTPVWLKMEGENISSRTVISEFFNGPFKNKLVSQNTL